MGPIDFPDGSRVAFPGCGAGPSLFCVVPVPDLDGGVGGAGGQLGPVEVEGHVVNQVTMLRVEHFGAIHLDQTHRDYELVTKEWKEVKSTPLFSCLINRKSGPVETGIKTNGGKKERSHVNRYIEKEKKFSRFYWTKKYYCVHYTYQNRVILVSGPIFRIISIFHFPMAFSFSRLGPHQLK